MRKNIKTPEYKYIIAGVCFVMVFAGLGFCSSAKSIYTAPITAALGFSRSAFSINDSCRFITISIVNVFFGMMVEKFGTKKLIIAGVLALLISSLLYSCATILPVFYLGGIFLGIGVAWTTTSMVGVVVTRWFKEKKGTVMGFVLASNGVGAAVAIHIVTPIIYSSTFGFRMAYRITALIMLAVIILVAILYREAPTESDSEKIGTEEQKKEKSGIEYKDLVKKPYFYGIMIAMFLHMLVSVGGITTPHFTDIGLSSSFVAKTLSMMVIALAIFKFLIGIVYDRAGVRISTNICLLCMVISKVILLLITNSFPGKVLTVVYCVINAVATPIETVMIPILALDIFGEKSFNTSLGILTSVTTAGQALGGPALNLFYDLTNSYRYAFVCSLAASVLVLIIMNVVMSASKKDKNPEKKKEVEFNV